MEHLISWFGTLPAWGQVVMALVGVFIGFRMIGLFVMFGFMAVMFVVAVVLEFLGVGRLKL